MHQLSCWIDCVSIYWCAFRHFCSFWLVGRMPKSQGNHELSVIIVSIVIFICDQFSYTHTICKYELCCVDRHAARNVPNLVFKLKKLQLKHILDKVTLAILQCKTKGKQMKVKDILNDTERQLLINLDEGFYITRTLRNSPAHFNRKKKDAFAMIRQLEFAELFVSQSAAETKWPELL